MAAARRVHRILVWSHIPGIQTSLQRAVKVSLPQLAPSIQWSSGVPDAFDCEDLAQADIIVADPPSFAPFVDKAHSLQWMQVGVARPQRDGLACGDCVVLGPHFG